jgi:hypothetical protein
MFTVTSQVLTVAAAFGGVLLLVGCVLVVSRKLRPWALAVLCGGVVGAGLAIGLLAFYGNALGIGREVIVSHIAIVLGAGAFALGGSFAAAVAFLFSLLRSVSRPVEP